MRRDIFYDEHNGVWRTSDGKGFGIVDDGIYLDDKRHRLKITSEVKYREFDFINFCREFEKQFGVAPNIMKVNEVGIRSISEKRYNATDKTFEIAEFKLKVILLDPDYRNDFLEIMYREQA